LEKSMAEFRFGRRTVIAAIEMLEELEHVQFIRFLLKLGPNFPDLVNSRRASVSECLNNLIKLTDQWPYQQTDDGRLLRDALVEKAVSMVPLPPAPEDWWISSRDAPDVATFRRALELDGYTITEGALRRTLPADVGLPSGE
jgi:hypothetical protein